MLRSLALAAAIAALTFALAPTAADAYGSCTSSQYGSSTYTTTTPAYEPSYSSGSTYCTSQRIGRSVYTSCYP